MTPVVIKNLLGVLEPLPAILGPSPELTIGGCIIFLHIARKMTNVIIYWVQYENISPLFRLILFSGYHGDLL